MKKLTRHDLDPVLARNMEAAGIDIELTLTLLNNYHRGAYDAHPRAHEFHIPPFEGERFFDRHAPQIRLTVAEDKARAAFRDLELELDPAGFAASKEKTLVFGPGELAALGNALLPLTAYGVLNGGSASSYADAGKNRAASEELYSFYRADFERLAANYEGRPKGVTSAFLNADGSPGPSFLELKLRAALIRAREHARRTGKTAGAPAVFQMTSAGNNDDIAAALCTYTDSPLLRDLARETGFDCRSVRTAVQPLLAAYTGAEAGREKRVFDRAHGEERRPLAMPGGHGQNFHVLKDVYHDLYREGYRFAYLGNIDNLGFTMDPVSLAICGLRGADAAFEFSFRTPIDVKGGILVENSHGRLDCRDLGPAVPFEEMLAAERSGRRILFNCAIGLFSLASLEKNLDRIIDTLPVRFSEQDKKAGRYAQAEQITWEVMGLLAHPLVLGVAKYERFLAVKVLVEGLMTSGLRLTDPGFPAKLRPLADSLHHGLVKKLSTEYGMKEINGRWEPKTLEELDIT